MNIPEGSIVEVKLGKQHSKGTVVAVDLVHGSILVQYDESAAGATEWLPQERCKLLAAPPRS
jgi:hypothetical protein